MENISQIIIDTLDGGIAPLDLVVQQKIEEQRESENTENRVTIPAPPRYYEGFAE